MKTLRMGSEILTKILTGASNFLPPIVRIFSPSSRIRTGILTGFKRELPEVGANPHESARVSSRVRQVIVTGHTLLRVWTREDLVNLGQ